MKDKRYWKTLEIRKWLRICARMLVFLILLLGIIFVFQRPSIGIYVWFFAFITAVVAWNLPWLGGILMIPVAILGFRWLPLGGWNFVEELPFIILLYGLIVNAVLFITVSLMGWILRVEWPLRKRA
jgi:hypothetical protein